MVVGGGVVAALAVATGVYLFGGNDGSSNLSTATTSTGSSGASASTSDTATSSTSSSTSTSSTTSTSSSSSTYKDGTYSATASYYVPHGTNSLTADVTIKDGVITAVSVDHNYSDHESAMYIDSFESALKSTVVGQSVGSLSFSRIGGATLTTEAFDQALRTIQSDAKA